MAVRTDHRSAAIISNLYVGLATQSRLAENDQAQQNHALVRMKRVGDETKLVKTQLKDGIRLSDQDQTTNMKDIYSWFYNTVDEITFAASPELLESLEKTKKVFNKEIKAHGCGWFGEVFARIGRGNDRTVSLVQQRNLLNNMISVLEKRPKPLNSPERQHALGNLQKNTDKLAQLEKDLADNANHLEKKRTALEHLNQHLTPMEKNLLQMKKAQATAKITYEAHVNNSKKNLESGRGVSPAEIRRKEQLRNKMNQYAQACLTIESDLIHLRAAYFEIVANIEGLKGFKTTLNIQITELKNARVALEMAVRDNTPPSGHPNFRDFLENPDLGEVEAKNFVDDVRTPIHTPRRMSLANSDQPRDHYGDLSDDGGDGSDGFDAAGAQPQIVAKHIHVSGLKANVTKESFTQNEVSQIINSGKVEGELLQMLTSAQRNSVGALVDVNLSDDDLRLCRQLLAKPKAPAAVEITNQAPPITSLGSYKYLPEELATIQQSDQLTHDEIFAIDAAQRLNNGIMTVRLLPNENEKFKEILKAAKAASPPPQPQPTPAVAAQTPKKTLVIPDYEVFSPEPAVVVAQPQVPAQDKSQRKARMGRARKLNNANAAQRGPRVLTPGPQSRLANDAADADKPVPVKATVAVVEVAAVKQNVVPARGNEKVFTMKMKGSEMVKLLNKINSGGGDFAKINGFTQEFLEIITLFSQSPNKIHEIAITHSELMGYIFLLEIDEETEFETLLVISTIENLINNRKWLKDPDTIEELKKIKLSLTNAGNNFNQKDVPHWVKLSRRSTEFCLQALHEQKFRDAR